MAATTSSYSITMRLHTAPDHGIVGSVATAIAARRRDRHRDRRRRVPPRPPGARRHLLGAATPTTPRSWSRPPTSWTGVEVHKVSDRTFLLHIGGKIEVASKVPLRNRDDLSMAYTPGVGRVSAALAENPDDVSRLTIKGNSVAVVTDGSAVLGLGNIGPGAALPVMEGKAALFKRFADIDAWPICLASQDTDEIVKAVEMIAPGFGGINLEDIAAPRCFEIERRLRESLDIPVFHDDQHGTAIVVLAALTNALRVVEKTSRDVAGRGLRRRRGRHGDRDAAARRRRHRRRGRRPRRAASPPTTSPLPPAQAELAAAHQPAPGPRRPARPRSRAPTCSSASARPACCKPEWIQDMADDAGRLRAGQPRPRGRPRRGGEVRRRGRQRPLRLPQPDQQRARVPRRLPRACSTPGPPTSPSTCCCARPRRSPPWSRTRSSTPTSSSRRSSTPDVPKAVAAAIAGTD